MTSPLACFRSVFRRLLSTLLGAVIYAVGLTLPTGAEAQTKPPEIETIEAPEPVEISGVAATAEGYAVVSNDIDDRGWVWPGGATWPINPPLTDIESLDVEKGPDGEPHWFILGEE